MNTRTRLLVSALTLSASAFVGIVLDEHYVDKAMIPVPGDRPTLGYGSTFHEDGTPVRLGDTTTPVRALVTARAHISKEEKRFQDSMPTAHLQPEEYDLYMNWVYQYGTGNWRSSSMRTNIIAENYTAACTSLLAWKKVNGADCSDPKNWYGKGQNCRGVWLRTQDRYNQCMALQ
jgi:lysozyme